MKQEIWRNYPVGYKVELVERLLERGVRCTTRDRAITSNRQPGKCCDTGCTTPGPAGDGRLARTALHRRCGMTERPRRMTRLRRIGWLKWGATARFSRSCSPAADCFRRCRLTAPLKTVLDKSPCTPIATTLVVMLPGAYSNPEEFVREGFVAGGRASESWRSTCCGSMHISATTTTAASSTACATTSYRRRAHRATRRSGSWAFRSAASEGCHMRQRILATSPASWRSRPTSAIARPAPTSRTPAACARWQAPTEMLPGDKARTAPLAMAAALRHAQRHVRPAAALPRLRHRRSLRLQPPPAWPPCSPQTSVFTDAGRPRLARMAAALGRTSCRSCLCPACVP